MPNVPATTTPKSFETPEIFAAVRAVVLATAYHQVMRETLQPVQQAAIDAANLKMDRVSGAPITMMKDTYLSTDEDAVAALWLDYKRRLREGGRYGLTAAQIEDGYCPELVAEHQKIAAESLLLDLTTPKFGINRVVLVMDKRREFLTLITRLVMALPSFDKNSLAL